MTCYYWDQDKKEVIDAENCYDIPPGMLIVDTLCMSDAARYGVMKENKYWEHKPLAEFPTEFRMELLLLGVA